MRFSQDFIEKVRDSSNIVDILSRHTQLERKGGRWFARCPYPDHNEKTPSFSVSEEKQVFYCFGCKKSGNVFTVLKDIDGFSFPESVEWLAGRAGIEMPKEQTSPQQDRRYEEAKKRKKALQQINREAVDFFIRNLKQLEPSHPWVSYLKQRGLTRELVQIFKIGICKDEWQSVVDFLSSRNLSLKEASHLGLIKPRKDNSGYFDIFRARLMFPIFNMSGEPIGFGGRVLTDEQPKYLNSPESDLFHKGKTFYGLHETAKFIRSQDEAILVEGYMDLVALYGAGIKNSVATLGTALTEAHARLIKRYTKNIVTMFDGDEAGLTAARRSLPILLKEGLRPKMLELPEGSDPDDYVKEHGPDRLRQDITKAVDLFSFILRTEMKSYSGQASEKMRVIEKVYPLLDRCEAKLKSLYEMELAEALGVEISWLRRAHRSEPREMGRDLPPPTPENLTPVEPASVKKDEVIRIVDPPRTELMLLNIALKDEEYIKIIEKNEIHLKFSNIGLSQVCEKAIQLYRQMPSKFDSLTALLVSEVQPHSAIMMHMGEPLSDVSREDLKKLFHDCELKVREDHLHSQSQRLQERLKSVLSDEESQEVLEQIMNIQKERHRLKNRELIDAEI